MARRATQATAVRSPVQAPALAVAAVPPAAGDARGDAPRDCPHRGLLTGTGAGSVPLQLVPPPDAPKVGSSFQVTVNLSGGHDVFSVPMQLQYDQTKMTLINVDSGDFLGSDGQAVALVHRDEWQRRCPSPRPGRRGLPGSTARVPSVF